MKKGYSLVEMMVVVALMSMVGLAVVAMFLSTARGGGRAGAMAIIKEEGDYALTTMERQIRYAEGVTCDPSGFPITIDPVGTGDDVIYSLNGSDQIQRTIGGVVSNVTSTSVTVSNLSFVCTANAGVTTVAVSFTMAQSAEGLDETFSSQITLRNKEP